MAYAPLVAEPTHSVVETASFSRRCALLKIPEAEYQALLDTYASDPAYGARIVGTGGIRKGRVAKADTGKSGGYRVFSLYIDRNAPVYLLWLIDKTAQENVTAEQKKVFKALSAELKKETDR